MSLRNAMQPLTQTYTYRGPKKNFTPLHGVHFRHIPPSCSFLHGPHCLSHDFTWSTKLILEKQTTQLSLIMVMPLYMNGQCQKFLIKLHMDIIYIYIYIYILGYQLFIESTFFIRSFPGWNAGGCVIIITHQLYSIAQSF